MLPEILLYPNHLIDEVVVGSAAELIVRYCEKINGLYSEEIYNLVVGHLSGLMDQELRVDLVSRCIRDSHILVFKDFGSITPLEFTVKTSLDTILRDIYAPHMDKEEVREYLLDVLHDFDVVLLDFVCCGLTRALNLNPCGVYSQVAFKHGIEVLYFGNIDVISMYYLYTCNGFRKTVAYERLHQWPIQSEYKTLVLQELFSTPS